MAVLERSAVAQEDLIRLATAERETGESILGPPICPHCGRLNPRIRNEGGDGQFGEFLLVAACQECGETFIAIAQGWLTFRDNAEYEGRET